MLTTFQKDIVSECMRKKRGCICVPMGSGKTLMSLYITTLIHDSMPALIVCSKTLLGNWVAEIEKFFDKSLKYDVFHKDYMTQTEFDSYIPDAGTDIVITTPEVLTKIYKESMIDSKFVEMTFEDRGGIFPVGVKRYLLPRRPFLRSIQTNINANSFVYYITWKCMIIDEIQQFSNIESSRCAAISAVYSKYRFGTSGTPVTEPKIERILGYYCMIGDTTFPNCKPDVERYIKSDEYPGLNSTMIVRTRVDFELPKCSECIISHDLTQEEISIYATLKNVVVNLTKAIALNRHNANLVRTLHADVLTMIMYMRQFLVCPLIPYANIMLNYKITELSTQFVRSIQNLNLNHWLNDPVASKSSRILRIIDTVNKHTTERCIIFTCFRLNLNVIKHYVFEDTRRPVFVLNSKDSSCARTSTISNFEETTNGILLLTYNIGSEGLNLQKSHIVLLADVWWNDAKVAQAIARVMRRGQTEEVKVYLFTSQTGIENGLYDKHIDKRNLINSLMCGKMNGEIRNLSMKEIVKMIIDDANTNKLKDARLLTVSDSKITICTS